jgi:hypothetical protein
VAIVKQPFPSNSSPATAEAGTLADIWYYLLRTLFLRGGGPGAQLAPVAVAVGNSPYLYETDINGTLVIEGGTVLEISIIRSNQNILTGMTQGAIPMVRGDTVAITYSGAPSATFLPAEALQTTTP